MDFSLYGLAAVPIVYALVEVAKETGLPGRFAPLLSLLLGIGAGIAVQLSSVHPDLLRGSVLGIALGLSASGLYSGIAKRINGSVGLSDLAFGEARPIIPASLPHYGYTQTPPVSTSVDTTVTSTGTPDLRPTEPAQ